MYGQQDFCRGLLTVAEGRGRRTRGARHLLLALSTIPGVLLLHPASQQAAALDAAEAEPTTDYGKIPPLLLINTEAYD